MCCASIDGLDRTEVEFVQKHFVLYHSNDNWRYLSKTQVLAEIDLVTTALEVFSPTVVWIVDEP